MFPGGYSSVLQARDREEFRAEVIGFAWRLGFDKVSAMTVIDMGPGQSEFITVDNTPPEYLGRFNDSTIARRDPVMQHCKRQSVPIVWDLETYVASNSRPKWEMQASYGYCTGIAMALHLPEGRHFQIGVNRDQALPQDPDELQRMVADLQLFAVHAQETALRLFVPPMLQPDRPGLTQRELEALRWTMDGKTAWEVGAIMGVTERTAVMHLQNAMRKLGAVNKHQAVLKALRLGLIQ
jgi:DNA-binding CsgD family transcriptional regulator